MITFSYKINYIINTHRKVFISFVFFSFFLNMQAQDFFIENQKTFPRVNKAFQGKENLLRKEFLSKGFHFPPNNILLVSYKAEGELQVWVKEGFRYELFKVYEVCKKSGDFGPKLKQGDRQVPEGIYTINVFNPTSDYHLSLGVSYPNLADRIRSKASDLGDDIYIHGGCVTVGCLPLTDNFMEEVYVLSVLSKNNSQSDIPIYLFPFKFNKLTEYIFYKEYPQNVKFWENLKQEYYYFKENRLIRNFTIDRNGNYRFY